MKMVEEILLVEDSPGDADLTIQALRQENMVDNVAIAHDGEEALDYLFCRGQFAGRSFDHPPRLVLLDLKLPKASGIEMLRQVKQDQRTKAIAVVILTSSKEEEDLMDTYNLGANSYIQKPGDIEQFREIVKRLGRYWLVVNQSPVANGERAKGAGQP